MWSVRGLFLLVLVVSAFGYGITPAKNFNLAKAVHTLKRAMSGWGTDEKAIIKVFTKHSYKQRKLIEKEFERRYDEDLADEIEDETTGFFEDALIGMLMNPLELGAYFVHEAMEGWGTDEDTMLAVLISLDNGEMPIFKQIYEEEHDESLRQDIIDDIEDYSLKGFFLSLLEYDRNQYGQIDEDLAKEDATHLAGKSGAPLTDQDYSAIFTSRSYAQLNRTFYLYYEITGYHIRDYIQTGFKGLYRKALESVVMRATDPEFYYTYWLHESMKGTGTNERLLTWILVTRSEIDLHEIAKRYDNKYGSLVIKIKDETSSDYEDLLLAILSPH